VLDELGAHIPTLRTACRTGQSLTVD
jgi:hypothetical protein